MSDVDRLTVVVACIGLLILNRIPENPAFEKWGFAHLTFDLFCNLLLMAGVIFPVLYIVGWRF